MNPSFPPFPDASAEEQAEYWLALRESPFYDSEQEKLWLAWLAASRENREAWQQTQLFFRRVETLHPAQVRRIERSVQKAGRAVAAGAGLWRWPIAACLMLAVCLGWAFNAGYFADFRTSTGEQRRIQLSDGSTVILNTASSLSVDFSEQQRVIRLHGGEAYFKVAADAARPFEVVAGGGRVRALGTAFDVKQWQGDLAVTVYEHSVRVAFADGATIERLPEGQRVASLDGKSGTPEQTNLRQAAAWQERRLVFKEKPLQQVIDDLNRYRPGKIVIADPDLAAHLVTGVFNANDPEAALTVIETTLAVSETRLTDAFIVLHRHY
ncbi:iron dicitrate transport regulator FecR [Methylomonas sp. Kb3]|uniref:FecR family protein n=1 Tax=Methylomonas sp. Kb3 TaxID=1611544 RepID=UPI000C321F66|nr:FecR family protein [Methylomonas sp. Kb3]PKD39307.1 iron dicitrate transport regulator FecR [Methylomonas sp. Kb3]